MENTLRVVLFKDHDLWVAHALEIDLCAQGGTEDGAVDGLRATIGLRQQLDKKAGREPFSRCKPAPPEYHAMFEHGVPWKPTHGGNFTTPSFSIQIAALEDQMPGPPVPFDAFYELLVEEYGCSHEEIEGTDPTSGRTVTGGVFRMGDDADADEATAGYLHVADGVGTRMSRHVAARICRELGILPDEVFDWLDHPPGSGN